MTPDVNVLVAASRSDHPHHRTAYAWLTEAIERCADGGRLMLLPNVAASFLRLVTHPRVFVRTTPTAAAIGFIDALIAVPGVEMPALGPEWPLFTRICNQYSLAANDIPDAWIAAAAQTHHARLVTFDRGFKRWLSARDLELLR